MGRGGGGVSCDMMCDGIKDYEVYIRLLRMAHACSSIYSCNMY